MSVLTTVGNPFTKYLWAGAALVIVLWHVAFGAFWNRHGRMEQQHAQDQQRIAGIEEARRMEQRRQAMANEAVQDRAKREVALRAVAVRVAAERDGLQHAVDVARERGAQSLDACRQHAAALEAVFGECRGQLQEMGQAADGHAADALMLQNAWPK